MIRTATIDPTGRYRYELGRRWAEGTTVLWVMLNPSKATAEVDDPTITRCISFSQRWGHGALEVVNLFAWRATDPKELLAAPARAVVGPDNDDAIGRAAVRASTVIAAWGTRGTLLGRARQVITMLRRIGADTRALSVTSDGEPGHPLYVKGDVDPVRYLAPWEPRA